MERLARRAARTRPPGRRRRALGLARAGPGGARARSRRSPMASPARCSPTDVLAVGQSLPFRPRRLGSRCPLDVAPHDRGPARARRPRLRPRARAVRPERVLGGAAPLARAERRHLPRPDRAGALDAGRAAAASSCFFGRLDAPHRQLRRHARRWSSATSPATTTSSAPAPTPSPAQRARTARSRSSSAPRRGARRAAPVPPRAAAAARSSRDVDARRCGSRAAGREPTARAAPRAARPGRASPARATGSEAEHLARADDRRRGVDGHSPAPQLLLRALGAGAVPVASRLPRYEEALDDGERGLLFEPRDATTLAGAARAPDRATRPASRASREPDRRQRRGPRLGPQAAECSTTSTRAIAARRHDPDGQAGGAQAAREARVHPRRPAHAHRPLLGLRHAGRHAARDGQGAPASARSR